MAIILCSLKGCTRPFKARKMCAMHYRRFMEFGVPGDNHKLAQLPRGCYLSSTDEYGIWYGMHVRIKDPNKPSYKGIKVCDRWSGDYGFQNFILDMDWRPSKDYSIDRIDATGNYEPTNCRWALKWQQSSNRVLCARNKSGYIGVRLTKFNKWHVVTTHQGLMHYIGSYDDPEEAAIEYDKYVIFFKGQYAVTNIL